MFPRDTQAESYEHQLRLYGAMSLERRGEIAARFSDDLRRVAHGGIRHRHPEYSDAEAFRALMALLFGESPCPPAPPSSSKQREGDREGGKRSETVIDVAPFLSRLVSALNGAGVPSMLAGSLASSMHGAPRATRDIDLVIDPTSDSLDGLLERLAREDFYLDSEVARAELQRQGQFNVIDPSTAWRADLIFRKARAFSRVEFERRTPVTLLGTLLFVATAEDTILAKLECAKLGQSEQQLSDVRGIVGAQGDALDRAYIEGWLDALGVRGQWEHVRQG